ncbi:MAG TPA: TonB family protein [Pyrinomonadaceae bacterium]
MRLKTFLKISFLFAVTLACVLTFRALSGADVALAAGQDETATPGSLQVLDAKGLPRGVCPLKRTDVKAEVSGFLSRVRVTQEFENPFKEKIEAVYTFPLPQNAAVDDMTMTVGERTVKGKILRREEAQAVYEAAKSNGQVASLLDQERPNIFTQSVANIMPGERVIVTISYVETLKYEDGAYEFVFPMVVAPRYIPGATSAGGASRTPNTRRVPDASRITPPVTPKGTRAGHDISLEVTLDAGVPLDALQSKSHEIEVERPNGWSARVRLRNRDEIPNRDFVLRYDVAGRRVEDALLAHRADRGGFFTFILQPPERVTVEDVTPKEIVFVLDTSGSMGGFPIEKAKEAMKLALDGLYPQDTFNLITFAGDTSILFPQPVPATKENLSKAQKFLETREGGGGTEMMTAVKAALDPSDAQDHIRIVCFMTDGEVGNDAEIISEVQKHPKARVFAFGIGSSVNRYLLDKIAEEGRGKVEYVSLRDDGSLAARKFHERVRSPLLTDISVDWGGLEVADVYPKRIPDLFSAEPVILTGRYAKGGPGVIRLKGKMSGRDFVREIPVNLPETEARHDVLATLWARTRVDDLTSRDYAGVQRDTAHADVKETITQLGLEYRLMTQYTSFVAVEEMVVTDGGQPRRIDVPVEMPEGMSRATTLGEDTDANGFISQMWVGNRKAKNPQFLPNQPPTVTLSVVGAGGAGGGGNVGLGKGSGSNTGGGAGAGTGGGGAAPPPPQPAPKPVPTPLPSGVAFSYGKARAPISGGVLNAKAQVLPKPAYPPIAKAAKASGTVTVQVTVDESGKVIAARAVSGHPLLQAAAAEAARRATFTPTKLSGQPVKVAGVITYNFLLSGNATITTAVSPNGQTVEEQRRQELLAKLNPSIAQLIDRLKDKQAKPGADEAKFVRDGKAELQVWLTEKSDEAIAELKSLGFEIVLDPKTARMVIGRVAIEKLEALAESKFVRYVAPMQSK